MKEFIKKYKLYIIIGISILILSITSTLAWYVWTSTDDALVNLEVCTPIVNVLGGSTINGTDIVPVLTKEEGLTKEITFNLNKKCNKDVDMNLYLSLDNFPIELADETFVYELYQGDTQIKSGNFANKVEGDTITLIENSILTENNEVSYKLYIYIDGNLDNNYEMAGKTFKFSLMARGNNAIFGENIISPNTVTSGDKDYNNGFLNIDNLERTSIETIDFIEINEDTIVPDNAVDISSYNDKSIMLWYNTSENDNSLYNVTIGSTIGTIKLNTSAKYMFANLQNLTEINGLNRLDTSEVTDMYGMFNGCLNLTQLDLSNFNTSKVTTMFTMFQNLRKIKEIDLSGFDTSNVTDMGGFFANCYELENLNLQSIDTSNVTNMPGMFSNCYALKSLDLSKFNTSKVTNMIQMFYNCNNLTSLDLRTFDTGNVTTMGYMFYKCSSLTSLDLSKFNTSKVENMSYMFYNCNNLKSLDLRTFDTGNVTTMANMFNSCSSLTSLDLSTFNTSKVTAMNSMFSGCTNLESITFGNNFITGNVTTMGYMFNGCTNLKTLDLSTFNTVKVENMSYMFYNCNNLTSITGLTEATLNTFFKTSNVTTMANMFNSCSSLTSLDLSTFNTSKVTAMNSMFSGCTNLESITFGNNFKTNNVTNMSGMFQGCSSLKSLDLSTFNTSKVTSMVSLFLNCNSLESINFGNNFDTSNVTSMYYMFCNCGKLKELNLNFNTSNVENMSMMFWSCHALTELDLSTFNTSKVTKMHGMFGLCDNLNEIIFGNNFDTSNVTDMHYMFRQVGLTELDLSKFNTSKVENMNGMFLSSSNINKIYVSDLWNIDNVTDSEGMFNGCKSLSGAVSYNSSNIDKSMANYTTGYLTYKANG